MAVYKVEYIDSAYKAYKSGEMKKNPYNLGLVGLFLSLDNEINYGYQLGKSLLLIIK